MSRVPSLLSGCNGHPEVTTCKRQTKCRRCKQPIRQNDICVDIPNSAGAFTSNRRYCVQCFKAVLDNTKKEIGALELSLASMLLPSATGVSENL